MRSVLRIRKEPSKLISRTDTRWKVRATPHYWTTLGRSSKDQRVFLFFLLTMLTPALAGYNCCNLMLWFWTASTPAPLCNSDVDPSNFILFLVLKNENWRSSFSISCKEHSWKEQWQFLSLLSLSFSETAFKDLVHSWRNCVEQGGSDVERWTLTLSWS